MKHFVSLDARLMGFGKVLTKKDEEVTALFRRKAKRLGASYMKLRVEAGMAVFESDSKVFARQLRAILLRTVAKYYHAQVHITTIK